MSPEELEQWLEGRPEETRQQEAVWIAHRCAMRVLPIWWAGVGKTEMSLVGILRAAMTVNVRTSIRSPGTRWASRRAAVGIQIAVLKQGAAAKATARSVEMAGEVIRKRGSGSVVRNSEKAARSLFGSARDLREALQIDVNWLERGDRHAVLPLWQSNPEGRTGLAGSESRDDGPWTFWTDWYQRVLDGTPQPMDLLEKIALQPDKFWDGTDSEVNTRIAEIVAEWEAGQEQNDPDRIDLFVATLFDFSYDKLEAVMRAVPVKGDWKRLEDENRVSAFLGDAEDLRESFELLCTALKAEGRTMQGAAGISTYIDAILATLEKAELGQGLRVDKLMEYGRILEGASQDDATMREFGALGTALKTNAENLRQIVRDHFAHTIARFSDLKDIRLEDGVSEWSALAQFREVVAQVKTGANGSLPPLAKDDAVMLEDVLESVDRLIRSKEIATSEEAKSSFRRDIDFQLAKVGATTAIYREKAERIGKKPIAVVDDGLKWNRRGEGLMGFGRWVWDYIKNGGG